MKTNKTNLKALVLSLGLAALMAPSAKAQNTTERPGGLFATMTSLEQASCTEIQLKKKDWISMWESNLSKTPLLWVAASPF